MSQIQPTKFHITHNLTDENDVNYNKYLLNMNGEHNKEEDIDESNLANLHSSSNSTASSVSCQSPSICTTNILKKQQPQVNRRRAFFHDNVIVTNDSNNNDNNHSLTMDDNQQILTPINDNDDTINEENSPILTNNNEENQTSKPFKRKVVSFSTMPFEKKVADGKSKSKKKKKIKVFF